MVFRSSITDSGIGMICNVFPRKLSRLLLALCPNITSSNFLYISRYARSFLLSHVSFSLDKFNLCFIFIFIGRLIDSGGIQFATAQLPLLELLDCGMTICDTNDQNLTSEDGDNDRRPMDHLHRMYQKLIIKHNKLKKLSLWGCTGLDVRFLDPKIVPLPFPVYS